MRARGPRLVQTIEVALAIGPIGDTGQQRLAGDD
jgi:hypothetical protein